MKNARVKGVHKANTAFSSTFRPHAGKNMWVKDMHGWTKNSMRCFVLGL